jgi:tryptophan 2,3-dioxygenase
MKSEDIVKQIEEKYEKLGENPQTYMKGLVQAKPITYWDYIQVDTLLSLQKPRTNYKDEEIFVMYHQVIELTLKLILHEIKQMTGENTPTEEILIEKIKRINRYTSLLMTSFDIMKDGMDYDDYNIFRDTLAPASGFQSAQFRFIEIYCTPLINLINEKGRERMKNISNPTVEDYFEHIYWKDAGHNRETGKKSLTLRQFEEKYLDEFIALAKKMQGKTLYDKMANLKLTENVKEALRSFDKIYNIDWPIVHLETARHFLDKKGETKAATGGSEWKKYLHPHFQQRKFFPSLWNEKELTNWGNNGEQF